jgi:hypothetical protein
MQFAEQMKASQIAWRRHALDDQTPGPQNGRTYDHVLPREQWQLNLWPGIRTGSPQSLPAYLHQGSIQRHTGSHNLCSSWVVCANLYFPFRSAAGREMLLGFLRDQISNDLTSVTRVELEYEHSEALPSVLGETDGHRGSGQTSPDAAFEVTTATGHGVVLVECKFVEHSFYPCSGRRKTKQNELLGRPPNPDPSRCGNYGRVLEDPANECHLVSWKRLYWDYLKPISDMSVARNLYCCPAAFGGYQLLRQHALAQAIATRSGATAVVSSVAHDDRNAGLMRCMSRSTGLNDIRKDWSRLFRGQVVFKTFTHQSWVAWVSTHDTCGEWSDWVRYIRERYGF